MAGGGGSPASQASGQSGGQDGAQAPNNTQNSMPPFAAQMFNPMQSYGPPPGYMQQMQAHQNFQQSSPYMDYMNKQRALQQEFESSQPYKDFQSQMQGYQQQSPMQMYGPPSGFGGLAGLFGGFRGMR